MNEGFLGSAAPRVADLVLLLEIGMGLGLLIGARLARIRRFRLHAWCQSVIVLLNLAVIGLTMLPSFRFHVRPKLWMRTVLVLWWLVLLLGFATYTRWYVPHLFRK